MPHRFTTFACFFILFVCPIVFISADDIESDSGWITLFDGSSTDVWREYGKDSITSGWTFEDGVMTVLAKEDSPIKRNENLITKEQFDAFELELEYRVTPSANSGVMFHVLETKGPPYKTGPEIQIQDNVEGHDPQKAGWLYQLYPATVDATKPAGQWNHLRVLISPARCEIEVNGEIYSRFNKGDAEWNERVAASKFSKWPEFGQADKGHICLQDHGDEVSYRNIRVRRIK